MITKFWHTGLTVKNLDKSVEQYKKLGFKVTDRFKEKDPDFEAVLMEHTDGGGVELFEFYNTAHPQVELIKSHLAFLSDGIDADIETMVKSGYEVVIPKRVDETVDYIFFRDPDGNIIEIAQLK